MYQRIDGSQWRHVFIVGDLHGCLNAFAAALRAHHFDPWQDMVISVGDLIDRGPDSPGCLRLLNRPWFFAVRGNHEEMALDALREGDRQLWWLNGSAWFAKLSETAQANVKPLLLSCEKLPLIIELHANGQTIVIAHADYPSAQYRWQQPVDEHQVVWSRDRLNRHMRGQGGSIAGADAFYFGHTPLKTPLDFANQHYIDTGAVFGNRLTLVQVQ
ncbi:metallophosphoesterase [Franconibacter pulveris 1160]|uniref:metallophosphoesterase n=1 Tax=Franconibacter pulveris TaxID=435910 RepID=UPI000465527B|nr:metallophosphoesterase [Franconibacter pulveris]